MLMQEPVANNSNKIEHDPPSVEVLPKEGLIVNETGEAVLTCSFSANPPNVTEVVWYKDGKPAKMVHPQATPSNNLKGGPPPGVPPFKPSNKLVLDGIMRAEAGSYSCHVRNAFGRGNSTNNITVDVLYPPTVRVGVTPSVAAESTEAVLTCDPVDGNPALLMAVRWHHDGDPIPGGGESTRLTLRNLTRDQSGNYTCRGLNTAGWSRDSDPQYLDIHCEY
ncbi:hypothetical protein AVEN_119542-1 [Araneus ventricosus]|uniref:Ig-like domain-containing protein n=1 Tax=Araneus ventricosus TaxID=182803 RepID=A0A4Y2JCJ7_ARAVE|nr:hypothetical protein AVEN_119542-1 [Araneus ventricosus]